MPDAEAVFAAAESGAEPAQAIIARSADAMETAVWSLIHTFLPEVLLIGGGIGERHFALYREAAERAIARAVLAPDRCGPRGQGGARQRRGHGRRRGAHARRRVTAVRRSG